MKRSGFTMIELVFVIVILGILASVAIPKLAATRDDAQIAKASTEVSALISDMGSYYTAQGKFTDNVSLMTNVSLTNLDSTDIVAGAVLANAVNFSDNNNTGASVFYGDITRGKSCIEINSVDFNGTITLAAAANAAQSPFCVGLNKAVAKLITKHTFGGSSIY
jgi:general secretion pathway protein G